MQRAFGDAVAHSGPRLAHCAAEWVNIDPRVACRHKDRQRGASRECGGRGAPDNNASTWTKFGNARESARAPRTPRAAVLGALGRIWGSTGVQRAAGLVPSVAMVQGGVCGGAFWAVGPLSERKSKK